jgi:hypothetical protein
MIKNMKMGYTYMFYYGCIYELYDIFEIEADTDADVGFLLKHTFVNFWHWLLFSVDDGSKLSRF